MLQFNYLDMHHSKAEFQASGLPKRPEVQHRHGWLTTRRRQTHLRLRQTFEGLRQKIKELPKALRDGP